jgi:hypothetical protein
LYELGYARIFGKQGGAFCAAWNQDAHIVLRPDFRYGTLDIQQAGPREITINLDWLLARGHHFDLVACLVEGDLGKEVFLLLKRVGNEGGNLLGVGRSSYDSFGFLRESPPHLVMDSVIQDRCLVSMAILAWTEWRGDGGKIAFRRKSDRSRVRDPAQGVTLGSGP